MNANFTIDLTDLYANVRSLFNEIYNRLKLETESLELLNVATATDNVFMAKQCAEWLDTMAKDMSKFHKTLSATAILKANWSGLACPPNGTLARAHIKQSTAAKIPSFTKDPEGYKAMCAVLGVPFDERTRLHYPMLKTLMSDMMEQTGELPDELKPFAVYEDVQLVTVALSGPQAQDNIPEYARR